MCVICQGKLAFALISYRTTVVSKMIFGTAVLFFSGKSFLTAKSEKNGKIS